MFDEKTIYSITDGHHEKTTITIDKWTADILQQWLPDVHCWLQEKYDRVCARHPHLSRREKGNMVRILV